MSDGGAGWGTAAAGWPGAGQGRQGRWGGRKEGGRWAESGWLGQGVRGLARGGAGQAGGDRAPGRERHGAGRRAGGRACARQRAAAARHVTPPAGAELPAPRRHSHSHTTPAATLWWSASPFPACTSWWLGVVGLQGRGGAWVALTRRRRRHVQGVVDLQQVVQPQASLGIPAHSVSRSERPGKVPGRPAWGRAHFALGHCRLCALQKASHVPGAQARSAISTQRAGWSRRPAGAELLFKADRTLTVCVGPAHSPMDAGACRDPDGERKEDTAAGHRTCVQERQRPTFYLGNSCLTAAGATLQIGFLGPGAILSPGEA